MKHAVASAILLFCHTAESSQCIPLSAEQVARTAEIAFVGEVSAIAESSFKPRDYCLNRQPQQPQCGGKRVTFRVVDSIRGRLEPVVVAVAEDACYCFGQYWSHGAQYLVVAKWSLDGPSGQLVVLDVCHGTMPVGSDAEPFIKALRSARR